MRHGYEASRIYEPVAHADTRTSSRHTSRESRHCANIALT